MTKARGRRLFLVSRQSNDSPLASPDQPLRDSVPHDPALAEVMIEGKRYRLVPVDAAPRSELEPVPNPLTAREAQIARLVADGFVNKQIAVELRISEWTVATHLRRIFAKLGVETRAAMVSRCFGGIGR